jgi:hypothetical protein
MKNLLLGLSYLALSFNTFAHTSSTDTQSAKMNFAPVHLRLSDNIATQNLRVVPGSVAGFKNYPKERQTMENAFRLVEQVINSEEFKQRVVNYVDKSGNRSYTNNRGLTNEQVYEYIMAGKEIIDGDKTPGEMNFDITRYNKSWSKVIGYTNIGSNNVIHVNGKFYRNYAASEIASNLTHEWIHLCGFVHKNAADHDSVPYAVGYIMSDLAKKLLKQGYLD